MRRSKLQIEASSGSDGAMNYIEQQNAMVDNAWRCEIGVNILTEIIE